MIDTRRERGRRENFTLQRVPAKAKFQRDLFSGLEEERESITCGYKDNIISIKERVERLGGKKMRGLVAVDLIHDVVGDAEDRGEGVNIVGVKERRQDRTLEDTSNRRERDRGKTTEDHGDGHIVKEITEKTKERRGDTGSKLRPDD